MLPELAAVDESRERLDVGAIAMIVRHGHDAVRARGGRENSFDAARVQRQRALAQHVLARRERAEHVRLVKMVRRRDDDRVERVLLEQILDVGVDVGNAEAVGERARFRPVVVAERDELRAAHLRQHRQMRELRDGSRADDSDSNGLLHGFALRPLTCRGCDQSNRCRRREPAPSGGRPRGRRVQGPRLPPSAKCGCRLPRFRRPRRDVVERALDERALDELSFGVDHVRRDADPANGLSNAVRDGRVAQVTAEGDVEDVDARRLNARRGVR